MTLSYDDLADVLYVTMRQVPGECQYIENARGQILKVDPSTSEIVGVTIPMFSRRIKQGEISLAEISASSLYSAEQIMTATP